MSAEQSVTINKQRIWKVISTALSAKSNGEYLFSKDIVPPEAKFIDKLKSFGAKIDSDCFAANALFLTTTFIRGGNTADFFNRINYQGDLEKFAWIFMPERILAKTREDVEHSVREFFRPPGYSGDAISKWRYNCQILSKKFHGDIRNFFVENNQDAEKCIKALYVRKRAKTWEKLEVHAFLGFGEKLAHLAIQWQNQYGLCEFKNAKTAGLPSDFQVGRIMAQTRGVVYKEPVNADLLLSRTILPVLKKMATEKELNLAEVSETLWTIGSTLCNKKLHNECPLQKLCTGYVTSIKYQRDGKFAIPTKKGRY